MPRTAVPERKPRSKANVEWSTKALDVDKLIRPDGEASVCPAGREQRSKSRLAQVSLHRLELSAHVSILAHPTCDRSST